MRGHFEMVQEDKSDERSEDKGLLHDREWMFADEKGKFITQRRYHRLALVHPKLVPDVENPTVRPLGSAHLRRRLG